MFSLESPQGKRKQPNLLASLTESLHAHQAPWHHNKVQVFAPRISAKRLPRQQLRVVKPAPPSPAAVLLLQHQRALHAALAFRNQVHSIVLSWRRLLTHKLSVAAFHIHTRRNLIQQGRQNKDLHRFPWRRHTKSTTSSLQVPGPDAACKDSIEQGLAAEHALDMRKAVQHFEEVVQHLPKNAYYLALLAKQWTDCTYLDMAPAGELLSDAQRREFNTTAAKHARQAMELDASAALPHIAACISLGRLALLSDNKTKVSLAHDARQEAVTALALEPSSDLAHHLMGRWHTEMANLNMVVRTLVRVMYGTALAPGTHQEALDSYQKAASLAPTRLIHRVELGRTLDRLGRKEEARDELEAALEMDIEDINAYLQRKDAVQLLKRLPKLHARLPSLSHTATHIIDGGSSREGQDVGADAAA